MIIFNVGIIAGVATSGIPQDIGGADRGVPFVYMFSQNRSAWDGNLIERQQQKKGQARGL